MYVLTLLALLSLLFSLLFTPLFRALFVRLGIVDQPDHDRKIHIRPIPRVGGLAIAFSYAAALSIFLWLTPRTFSIDVQHRALMFALAPAASVVFITGLMDDLWSLKPKQKLAGQFIAAVLAVIAGLRINLFEPHSPFAFLAIPVTVIWLVGYSNAFNLIDGMDGLAAGVGLFAAVTTLLAAALHGDSGLATATVPLVGCLLGFLFYNFNPASVFLGDSGSLTIGFLLGCFGVIWSQKSATFLGLFSPLMALSLPLMDTFLAIGRRFLSNKPVFSPDKGHIHHRLLALGLHPRVAVLILYAVCAAVAVLSLVHNSFSYQVSGLCLVAFCALTWFGIKKLRYIEFRTASRVLRSGGILHLVQHEIYLQGLRELLAVADSPAACWQVIRSMCKDLAFASARLTLQDEHFEEDFQLGVEQVGWEFSLPISNNGRIQLTRAASLGNPMQSLAAVCALQDGLRVKTFGQLPASSSVASPARDVYQKIAEIEPSTRGIGDLVQLPPSSKKRPASARISFSE